MNLGLDPADIEKYQENLRNYCVLYGPIRTLEEEMENDKRLLNEYKKKILIKTWIKSA